MKKNFLFTFIFAITGAIVGAGFASGREITTFFAQYGFWSLLFVAIAGIMFGFIFILFSKIGSHIKPNSITDMTTAIFGKASIIVDFVFIISSFITLSSMLAGLDSSMTILFGKSYSFPVLSIAVCMLVVILLEFGLKKIFKFTNLFIPVLFVAIITITLLFLMIGSREQVSYGMINHSIIPMTISPILYVSMNVFGNVFLIAKSSIYLKKYQITTASVLSAILLCLSMLLVTLCILFGGEDVFNSSMPMLSVASKLGKIYNIIYFLILIIAIFTTVCTSAFAISTWLNNYISNKFLCGVIVLTIGFIFSRFGFTTIVDIFYPIEGIFALIFIVFSLIYYCKSKVKFSKNKKQIVDALIITKKNGQVVIKKKYRSSDKGV